RTKPSVTAAIDELEKLRQPLSAAVSEEINLAIQCHQVEVKNRTQEEELKTPEGNNQVELDQGEKPEVVIIEDLLNLLYFV
ncbi:hypothetical protein, partial [Klebsiella pneumoniae]|uniref:hypothetical protein n=1 Tax=Klebsiella pneumoniae TaxID=573 RepID=UPI003013A4DB